MQRWMFTALLGAAAVGGVALAPRFFAGPAAPPPRPASGGPVSLEARLDQGTLLRGEDAVRFLVLTLSAPADPRAERVPVDLALVMDTSGSMSGEGKITHAREAAHQLVDALREGDRFSLVGFSDAAKVLLPATEFDPRRRDALHDVIDALEPGGATNLSAGLDAGYTQMGGSSRPKRLVVVSDGQANRGVTRVDRLREAAAYYASHGVTVSGIGLGADYNEVLMEGLADSGGGSYAFVEHAAELPRVIAAELDQAANVVARDLTVDVRLEPGVRLASVHGWEASVGGDGATVYAGELAAGQTKKIVLELQVEPGSVEDMPIAAATVRYDALDDSVTRVATAAVTAKLTDDASLVRASVDPKAKVAAVKAQAGTLAAASAEDYRAGDAEAARAKVQRSSALLQVLATTGTAEGGIADQLGRGDQQEIAELEAALRELSTASPLVQAKSAGSLGRQLSK